MTTKEMKKEIENKEKLTKELNTKTKELVKEKIFEKTERAKIITEMEANATKKLTDKTKQAQADNELSETIKKIKTLDCEIECIKRNIEIINDKIELYKYEIRELRLIDLRELELI